MKARLLAALSVLLLVACAGGGGAPAEIATVKRRYEGYTVARAEQEGYGRDQFCLDATSFGQPASRGPMGFHATNEALLRGPIAAERPQALMFDAEGKVLGVEYEVMADAVKEPPKLFGKTFAKLPPHPGVDHEHYTLHVWIVDNPSGWSADFNPRVSCPPGSTWRTMRSSSWRTTPAPGSSTATTSCTWAGA